MKAMSLLAVLVLGVSAILAGCTGTNTNTTVSQDTSDGSTNETLRNIPVYPPLSAAPKSPTPQLQSAIPQLLGLPLVPKVTDTTAIVRWTVDAHGDLRPGQAVYSFVVLTNIANLTDQHRSPEQAGLGERDATVTGLKPGAKYSVQVFAHLTNMPATAMGSVGGGGDANVFGTLTDPNAPAAAPPGNVRSVDNVTVTDITANDPPELGGPGSSADVHFLVKGNGTVYSWVQYGSSINRMDDASYIVQGTGGLTIALTGLDPSQNYFAIVYSTAGGVKVASKIAAFHTPDRDTDGTPPGTTFSGTPVNGAGDNRPSTITLQTLTQVDKLVDWPSNLITVQAGYESSGSGTVAVAFQFVEDSKWVLAGHKWPSVPDQTLVDPQPEGTGSVQASLKQDTLYHLRLRAQNNVGTPGFSFSAEKVFLTLNAIGVKIIKVKNNGCVVSGGIPIDPANQLSVRLTNSDTNSKTHEWVLLDKTPQTASPTVLGDGNGGLIANAQGLAQFQGAAPDPTRITLPVPPPNTIWGAPPVYRMVVNQLNNDGTVAQPFWDTGVPGGVYSSTGRPGALLQPATTPANAPTTGSGSTDVCGYLKMTMGISSDGFADGQTMPATTLCTTGASPELNLLAGDPSAGSRYAFEMVDTQTTPPTPYWFWWNLKLDTTSVPIGPVGGGPYAALTASGAVEGNIGGGNTDGYHGPCVTAGQPHHFELRLYNLSGPMALAPGSNYAAFQSAITAPGAYVQQATLVGFA